MSSINQYFLSPQVGSPEVASQTTAAGKLTTSGLPKLPSISIIQDLPAAAFEGPVKVTVDSLVLAWTLKGSLKSTVVLVETFLCHPVY